MRRDLIIGAVGSLLSVSVVFAQTTTPPAPAANQVTVTPAPTVEVILPLAPSLVTTTPVAATELGVPERPGVLTVLGLKLQRLFALTDIAKARATERLARTLLQQARVALSEGHQTQAAALLTRYNQETARASQLIGSALAQVDVSQNPAAQTLITQLEETKLIEAAVVDEMALKATGEFNKRLLKERAEIAKKLVKLLTKEDLSPAELERKIAKLTAKLAEKEAKTEAKLAKRLATLDLLDQAADEAGDEAAEVDEAIGAVEEDEIAAIAAQPTANLGALVSQIPGSTTKHLVVLQALLDRVPEAAKSTIEAVLAKELEKAKIKLDKKQAELDELVDSDSAKLKDAKEKVLAKLQEKADEKIIKAIEKATKKLQKAEERRIKLLEKQAKVGEEDDDEDDQATPDATASPSPTSSPSTTETPKSGSSGSSSVSTPEPKTYKIELEDDGFKATSLSIKVGDSVTFEVKDEGSYQIRSGPHPIHTDIPELDSGVVAKGAKYSFTFSKAGSFRFHDHLHPSFTGTVTVK